MVCDSAPQKHICMQGLFFRLIMDDFIALCFMFVLFVFVFIAILTLEVPSENVSDSSIDMEL